MNWGTSLVAAFFSLVGCAAQIFAGILRLAPLAILTDSRFAGVFSTQQLQTMAMLSLTLHAQTFDISLVLFGLYDLLIGYLVFRSTFLPRFLGALLIVAGIGWLVFLWPPLATVLAPYILPIGALAEIVFMFWLLVRGVDALRWQEIALSGAGGRSPTPSLQRPLPG